MTYVVAGRSAGYGLLELIIVMVVAALLAALEVPAITALSHEQKLHEQWVRLVP